MKYKVGQKVICDDPQYSVYGEIGTIVDIYEDKLYVVRFNRNRGAYIDLDHFEYEVLPYRPRENA
jgi:hypothetical protein